MQVHNGAPTFQDLRDAFPAERATAADTSGADQLIQASNHPFDLPLGLDVGAGFRVLA